jgi:hypothetical protein
MMAKQPGQRKSPVSSRDQGQLSIQIDVCADRIAELIGETRARTNDAIVAGDLDTADKLADQSLRQTVQYAILIRHELKKIDDSQLMRETIKGFSNVNAYIEKSIRELKELKKFLSAVTSIAGTLDKLIGMVLVA